MRRHHCAYTDDLGYLMFRYRLEILNQKRFDRLKWCQRYIGSCVSLLNLSASAVPMYVSSTSGSTSRVSPFRAEQYMHQVHVGRIYGLQQLHRHHSVSISNLIIVYGLEAMSRGPRRPKRRNWRCHWYTWCSCRCWTTLFKR